VAYLASDVRRETIIDAAIEVIASEGLARATTRRIAEAADAPLGSLHYCFRSKDELIESVLARAASTMEASFEDIHPEQGFAATLRASVAAYWQWIQKDLGLHLALFELLIWTIRRSEHGANLYRDANEPFGGKLIRSALEEAAAQDSFTPAVSIDDTVRFLLHRFDGLVFEFAESRDVAACQRQTELLAEALLFLTGAPSASRGSGGSTGSRRGSRGDRRG
jgi:AcrR family transcriptional regulator